MAIAGIVNLLQPVVENLELVSDYITPEEESRARELAMELRAVYDAAVLRLKSGRVG